MSALGDRAGREALELSESITLAIEEGATTVFDADGTVPVHIIRPGVGKGRGRHLYEASMLQRNATKFSGWRMYVDHQSPEARKAAGGLPRSVRDLGGRIVEASWDPSVPADPQKGYGQGAVVGRARPAPFIRELIESDPGLIEASISASATGVRPVNHEGQRVWMVEGINDRGSVDWVTEAGAGGRVAPLIEASYASEEKVEMALLESMSDEEVREFLRESRPSLMDEADDGGKGDDMSDADMSAVARLVKEKGMSEKAAKAWVANKKKMTESTEEDDMPVTPEALQEALSSQPEVLVEAIKGSEPLQSFISECVQSVLAEERTISDAERDAVIDRQWELRDMRDAAHAMIAESKLPDTWQDGLRKKFTLREDRTPTGELDIVDDYDSEGAVTKSALDKLRESVTEAVKDERARLAEVAPTRVRNQGPAKPKDGEEVQETEQHGEPGLHRTLIQEAGMDPDTVWDAA